MSDEIIEHLFIEYNEPSYPSPPSLPIILRDPKIYIFIHIYCADDVSIFHDQIHKIIFSGLYAKVDFIFCFLVGSQSNINTYQTIISSSGTKFIVADTGVNDTTYEVFTLSRIHAYIQDNDKILYIHTKGNTDYERRGNKGGCTDLDDYNNQYLPKYYWRTYMEYFLIANHDNCIKSLDEYDTIGVNFFESTEWWWKCAPHYSGNFWWCTGKYYLSLPREIDKENYWASESYILSNQPKWLNLYDSGFRDRGVTHYHTNYTFGEYIDNYPIRRTVENSNKIKIFYHIFCNEFTAKMMRDQVTKIIFSGLYASCDNIYCFLVGNEERYIDECKYIIETSGSKFTLADVGLHDATFERFTLLKIKQYIEPSDYILYVHTKGVTRLSDDYLRANVIDWKTYMEYFMIAKWEYSMKLLNDYDTTGVNYNPYIKKGLPHYSGNFWWCRGSYYMMTDDEIDIDDYWAPEFFLFKKKPNFYEIHNSNTDQYNFRYPYACYL